MNILKMLQLKIFQNDTKKSKLHLRRNEQQIQMVNACYHSL